jgi:excisionase family DNA binding protein
VPATIRSGRSAPLERQQQVLADLEGRLFATVPETSVVLRADEPAVRRMIAAGDIPATRVGRVWRVPVSWIRTAAGL